MTYCVLQLGGAEVNPLALAWLQLFGHWGLIVLKYTSLLIVVAICEMIARRQTSTGQRLAEWAVVIAALPVVLGLVQIAGHT